MVKVVVHVLGALRGIMKFCGDTGGRWTGHWHKVIQLVRALKCPLPQRHKCKTEGIGLFLGRMGHRIHRYFHGVAEISGPLGLP